MNAQKGLIVISAGTLLSIALFLPTSGRSHCEIPCGIYDDPMRLDMIAEHIQTIEKSMNQIIELAGQKEKNYNQLARWVMNKENHADQLSEIVTQYFMTQRVAPVEKGKPEYTAYVHKITLLHSMMVHSMKCKQTTDLEYVSKLRADLEQFRRAYLNPESAAEHDHAEHSHSAD